MSSELKTPFSSLAGTAGEVFSDAPDLERRFAGLQRLYGKEGAARIFRSHVAIVGIGGVGSWIAESLARSGVSKLTLIDLDNVAESNINRQVHALTETIGMAKVEAMKSRIGQINPHCEVICVEDFVDAENWPAILPVDAVDAVIDACDQIKAKAAIANWARRQRKLFIAIGAAGGKRHAHLIDLADLADTTHDPLLAQLRYRLRKQYGAPLNGKKMRLACVFSKEPVAPPHASCSLEGDGSLNCSGYGSVAPVTAAFGMCASAWVLDRLSSAEIL